MKKLATALSALLLVLTGCADPGDPERMTTRCEGHDKLYILDDPNQGSELFVVPDHPDCGARVTE